MNRIHTRLLREYHTKVTSERVTSMKLTKSKLFKTYNWCPSLLSNYRKVSTCIYIVNIYIPLLEKNVKSGYVNLRALARQKIIVEHTIIYFIPSIHAPIFIYERIYFTACWVTISKVIRSTHADESTIFLHTENNSLSIHSPPTSLQDSLIILHLWQLSIRG